MNVSRSAAGDNALFYGCTCCIQRILHTKLSFLHLGLGCSADTDDSYAAGHLRQSLLQLLLIELRCGVCNLGLDLRDTILDIRLLAKTFNDGGLLLGHLYRLRTAALLDGSILQLQTDLLGDHLAAGQDRDILQHFLTSVAVARCLDSNNIEGTSQLVDDESGQCLALDVLSNDQQLSAALHYLLQQRKDILDVGDLLVGDQDEGIVQRCLHLLHVGAHISADIAAVKLHAFYQIQLGLHGLGLLNGDDAVLGNLLHGICHHLAYALIASGNAGYLSDLALAGYHRGLCLDGLYSGINSLADTLTKDDGVGTGLQVLHTLSYDGLCQNGCSCGTVTGNIVGLGSHLSYQLCAHVLIGILEVDLLRNGNAVVGDQRCTVALVQNHVSALRSKGYLNGICHCIYTCLESLPGLNTIFNFLSHISITS